MDSRRFVLQGMLAIVLVSLAVGSLAGCSSTISAVGRLLDDAAAAAIGETVEEENGNGGQNTSGGQSASGGKSLFGGMAALENVMLFNVAYMQVFFLGGYDPGFEEFKEGEGITWEITAGDDSDQSSFTAERALLRRNSDGTSWWFLGYVADEEDLEYEVLMDHEYAPLEIVWRDSGSAKTMRHTFDYGEEGEESPAAEESAAYSDEDYSENSLGRERITVGSGTYTAEHIAFEIKDDGSGARLEYDWWLAEEVPGNLVKYEYRQISDGEESMISGELVDMDDGYTTRMDAY